MTRWMLDTNAVSYAVHRRSKRLDQRLTEIAPAELALSAVTYGEICFGLAQKPDATTLAASIDEFLSEIAILPWSPSTAETYGELRATLKHTGKSLSPLDMLIAAHALEAGAILVTSDRAFADVPGLAVEDWTAD